MRTISRMSVGVDLEEVRRFRRILRGSRASAFLAKVCSAREVEYCFRFADPVPRIAGHFVAKEAVVKACGGRVAIPDVEIRHTPKGAPRVYVGGVLHRDIAVSIAHTAVLACAVAIRRRGGKRSRKS